MSVPDQALKLSERESDAGLLIEAYGDGGFRLAGQRVEGALLLVEDQAFSISAENLASLEEAVLQPLMDASPPADIVLIGWGTAIARPPAPLRDALDRRGLAFDAMDTGAAARTYNVLRMEDRRVAAILMPVE